MFFIITIMKFNRLIEENQIRGNSTTIYNK